MSELYDNEVLLDTMLLIENIRNKKNEKILFCELSLFEILKNKDIECQIRKFKDIDEYVKKTNSEMLTKIFTNKNIFDDRDINIRFDEVLKGCIEISKDIGWTYLFYAGIIIYLLCINKMDDILIEEYKEDFENSMAKIFCSINELSKNYIEEIALEINNRKTEILDDQLFKELTNYLINKINQTTINPDFRLNPIKKLNTNDMVFINDMRFNESRLDYYLDQILDFKSNEFISKEFYKSYFKGVLMNHNVWTLNDIIDMNIIYCAISNNLIFKTRDKKMKKKYGQVIDKYMNKKFILVNNIGETTK